MRSRPTLRGAFLFAIALAAAFSTATATTGRSMFPKPLQQASVGFDITVTTDLNGDGKLDLVSGTAQAQYQVSVFYGLGEGLFAEPIPVWSGPSLGDLALADFDNDDVLDIAITLPELNSVAILHGKRGGTYVEAGVYAVGRTPYKLAIADLNSDTFPDLAVANLDSTDISILLGDGNGGFPVETRLPLAASPRWPDDVPDDVALGEFNADGIPDLLVVQGSSDLVAVFLGKGDGSFSPPFRVPVADRPGSLVLIDANGDSLSDVVVLSVSKITVLLGSENGHFTLGSDFEIGETPSFLRTGDLNGDHIADLVLQSGFPSANITSFLGTGKGSYNPVMPTPVPFGNDLQISDFTCDGILDALIIENGFVSVLFPGGGDGSFQVPLPSFPTGGLPVNSVTADFNKDGELDIATLGAGGISVLLGTPGPGFLDSRLYTDNAGGRYTGSIAVGDFNNDGKIDLTAPITTGFSTCTQGPSHSIGLLLGRGDGTFVQKKLFATACNPVAVAVGDFNRDGLDDIAVVNGEGLAGVTFLLGTGNANFKAGPAHMYITEYDPSSATVADFDRDGIADLAVGFGYRSSLTLADFNRDGIIDVALYGAQFRVFHGLGDGNFTRGGIFGETPGRDPNGSAVVLDGVGDGTFVVHAELSPWFVTSITSADLDDDGWEDLIIAVPGAFVPYLSMQGTGFRQEHFYYGAGLYNIRAGDFNHDGLIDVVNFGYSSMTLSLNQGGSTNKPPHAVASAESQIECSSPAGGIVLLDGSASSDSDSSAGTNDDIGLFAWYEDFGLPTQTFLGLGERFVSVLPLGRHTVTLRVTDAAMDTDRSEASLAVVDITPPSISVEVTPKVLWPPNHQMVDMVTTIVSTDACGPVDVGLESVTSSEPDDAPGDGDGHTTGDIEATIGTTTNFRVRAERSASGSGRVYTVTYRAQDRSGNTVRSSSTVMVPLTRTR